MSSSILTAKQARAELASYATKELADAKARFFQTGKGQYGEGDVFVGVTVPDTRRVMARCTPMVDKEILSLLRSKVHEERLLALLIWVRQFERGDDERRAEIHALYLKEMRWVNNWDLVDTSAPSLVGLHLLGGDKRMLRTMARSEWLWERRIAVVATLAFIRARELKETFALCKLLLNDQADLMHKACGWMLREAGKKDIDELRAFLFAHAPKMPRTMLRYAIEHMSKDEQKMWRERQ